jgi:A/G-specific adenine glycosylase
MSKLLQHPFSETIIAWYSKNARDLPWRKTKDPYVIWLSEIILQQTRVAQGLPYFHRLLEAFPSVLDLAQADEDYLFRLWQGLGYYSRARNLHKAAKMIAEAGGNFPTSYAELVKLPGVGPYTAAAIASFAFDEPKPVVDGNVFRILARYFGVEVDILHASARKTFTDLADELIPKHHPAIFNQAIMEFGSLQCSPAPSCSTCPLQFTCVAFSENRVQSLPVKSKKKSQRERYFTYFIVEQKGKVLVRQRASKDIWQGLWEFYLLEMTPLETIEEEILKDPFLSRVVPQSVMSALVSPPTHLLSHQKIFCQAWYVQVNDHFEVPENDQFRWIEPQDFTNMAKPVLILNLITDNLILKNLF